MNAKMYTCNNAEQHIRKYYGTNQYNPNTQITVTVMIVAATECARHMPLVW